MNKRFLILLCVVAVAVSSCGQPSYERLEEESIDTPASPYFNDTMDKLVVNMQAWNQLNQSDKARAVRAIVSLYKIRENVAILNPPSFYAAKIDENLASDPSMAGLSLPSMVKVVAVMEYDFYNGQDKDQLAKEILGERLYEENKRRREVEAGAKL